MCDGKVMLCRAACEKFLFAARITSNHHQCIVLGNHVKKEPDAALCGLAACCGDVRDLLPNAYVTTMPLSPRQALPRTRQRGRTSPPLSSRFPLLRFLHPPTFAGGGW